ncbi:hypothetical protein LPJ61_002292 [Coemansia biformis]|uniref:Uncharacterized protein n=1 Tax=Coemansia biformis TaxID=1286918 RepID=A0A9W7YET8_9FUNG|nr:hypothetical protein LPJ61_002292 [Coemansia biformis]
MTVRMHDLGNINAHRMDSAGNIEKTVPVNVTGMTEVAAIDAAAKSVGADATYDIYAGIGQFYFIPGGTDVSKITSLENHLPYFAKEE